MKNLEFLASTLFLRTRNKFQNIKQFLGGFNEIQWHKVKEGHILDLL